MVCIISVYMQTQRINITLPYSTMKQLYQFIPSGKRSEFIAETITERLTISTNIKQEFKRSFKENGSFYNQVSKDWNTTELEIWPK